MSHEDAPALDPEELAAYIDGRLSGERKAQVEAALTNSEDDYEVFLESVRTLEAEGLLDDEATEAKQTLEPIKAKPIRGTVTTLDRQTGSLERKSQSLGRRIVRMAPAGGSLLAAGLALSIGLRFVAAGASPADLAPETDKTQLAEHWDESDNWDDPGWNRYRSGAPPPTGLYPDEAIAFRLGVRGIDLRVAEKAGDLEQLSQLVRNTGSWAGSADLASEFTYDTLAEAIDEKQTPEEIARQLDVADEEVALDVAGDPVMKQRYRLGLWAEAGRLAARTRNGDALRARKFRWRRTGLARADPAREEAEAMVATIKQQLKRKTFSDAAFGDLERAFIDLIKALAG